MIYAIDNKPVDPKSSHYQLLETLRTDEKTCEYVRDRIQGSHKVQEEYESYYTQAKELGKEYWEPEMMPKLPGRFNLVYQIYASVSPNLQTETVLQKVTFEEERTPSKECGISSRVIGSVAGTLGTAALAALAQRLGLARLARLARWL